MLGRSHPNCWPLRARDLSTRLPIQAPTAPPRKGRAWQDGYMAGIEDARDMIALVLDGVQLRAEDA